MLEGMKVLSFVHGLYGCGASQILADLGADVVRVEWDTENRGRPGSDYRKNGEGIFFLLTGRNQKSFAADLSRPGGRAAVVRLLEEYDTVIENCPPGFLAGLGLGYETLRTRFPRLVWCSCTAYGNGGPRAGEVDDELLMQAASGLAWLNGPGSKPPVPAGAALIEQHAASLLALGLVAAARDRDRTGRGHLVETNLLLASLDMQIETVGYYSNGGRFIPRVDTGLSTRIHQSPYGVYHTADGYITVSLTHHDRLSQIFTPGVMDRFTERDAMENREEFDKVVCEELKKRTTAEWIALFDTLKDMWYSPVNEYEQMLRDEQVIYNRPFLQMQVPEAGKVQVLGHPNRYDGENLPLRSTPPAFGEDTGTLLRRCGYTEEEIEALDRTGTVQIHQEKKE